MTGGGIGDTSDENTLAHQAFEVPQGILVASDTQAEIACHADRRAYPSAAVRCDRAHLEAVRWEAMGAGGAEVGPFPAARGVAQEQFDHDRTNTEDRHQACEEEDTHHHDRSLPFSINGNKWSVLGELLVPLPARES